MSLLQYSVVFILIQYGIALSKGEGCLQAEKKTCILELANLADSVILSFPLSTKTTPKSEGKKGKQTPKQQIRKKKSS